MEKELKEYEKRDGRRIDAVCNRLAMLWKQKPQETFTNTCIRFGLINELGNNYNTPDDVVMMKLGIKGIKEFPFRYWAEYKNSFKA